MKSFRRSISFILALLLVFSPLSSLGYAFAGEEIEAQTIDEALELEPEEILETDDDEIPSGDENPGEAEEPVEAEEPGEDDEADANLEEQATDPIVETEETGKDDEENAEPLEETSVQLFALGKQSRDSSEEGTAKDLGNIFTGVSIEANNVQLDPDHTNEIEITSDLKLKVEFDWEIADDVELNNGDYAQLQLPHMLSGVTSPASGNLIDEENNNEVVGTYEISDSGLLKVVFNDKLAGDIKDRHGKVGMLLKFDVSVFEEDIYQEITFGEPIGKTFKLKTEQTGTVYDLKKFGKADAPINTSYIDWTVDVNTKLESLTNGSVEDPIPAGLTIDPSSVEVYELKVGSKGDLTEGNKVTKSYTTDGGVLKVDLGATDKAYRIKFKTNIDGKLKEAYTNTAILKENGEEKASASAGVEGLTRGSSIEKQGWQNTNDKDQIIWRIYVNKAEEALNNVKILDSLPAGLTLESIHYWHSDAAGNYGTYVGKATEFPLVLGDITGTYVIEVKQKLIMPISRTTQNNLPSKIQWI